MSTTNTTWQAFCAAVKFTGRGPKDTSDEWFATRTGGYDRYSVSYYGVTYGTVAYDEAEDVWQAIDLNGDVIATEVSRTDAAYVVCHGVSA